MQPVTRSAREQFSIDHANRSDKQRSTYLQYLRRHIYANGGQWRRWHWSGWCGSWPLLLQALPEFRLSPLLLMQLLPHQLQLQLRARRRRRCFERRRAEKPIFRSRKTLSHRVAFSPAYTFAIYIRAISHARRTREHELTRDGPYASNSRIAVEVK